MILADASVVIDFLRTSDPGMTQIILGQKAAICGVTRAEVLHGARGPQDRQGILAGLGLFLHVPIAETLWDLVGDHLASLRGAGVSIPFADAVIATVAIANDIELWTRDNQFKLIQQVLPALKLFQEPP